MNPSAPTPAAPHFRRPTARAGLALAAAALMAGCAQVPNPSPNDPWESYNRGMYRFNDTVDRAVLKPIATGYETVTPRPVRTCIHNIFGNLADVWSGVNSLLQGRGRDFVDTFGRVLFNSTAGLGGCIDVASMHGARRIPNDLGMTLGVWGLGQGPYFVMPFLGPSTVRDSAAFAASLASPVSPTSAVFAIDNVPVRNSLLGLYIVDTRASLLEADRLVDQIALDKYSFIRDAYLQRRKAMLDSRQQGGRASTEESLEHVPAPADQGLPVYEDPDATPAQ
ncbi:Surface lipoprotein [Castellaniella defragrans 65Phen]|uniref:Surface lipoprotein n=1 Tax=Castellaniella defragrans (strain DSM 12143 / CCUG 39792 / 65Phen) TaxID=1437824 RepID=W8WS88_CASD6|nr:Surface lipoprotein [Castellaniella defragrans 65Phen]